MVVNILSLVFFLLLEPFCATAGSVVLKKGVPLSKQIIAKNTTYEIGENFDLTGATLILPSDVVLEFKGGSISGGTIVFNRTTVHQPKFSRMHFRGSTSVDYFDIEDYGAQAGVKSEDCSVLINELVNLESIRKSERNAKTIHIPNGTFYIKKPIILWAGWEAPITLEGNGNTSVLCQLADDEYIIKVYECHYVKNLKLTYNKRQGLSNIRAVAVACQRAIFCLFENITVCKAYNAFGYISLADAKKDGFTGLNEQCYVSCNFRNIRIYEFSNYAFDFKKERDGGDSGSVYDNVYINSNDWLSNTRDNVSKGAVRGANTVMVFSQLNVEGDNYTGPLFELGGMSRIVVACLHMEGIKDMPMIAKIQVQSVAVFDIIDVQACRFFKANYYAFEIRGSGLASIDILTIRQDCKRLPDAKQTKLTNNTQRLKIGQRLDAIRLF